MKDIEIFKKMVSWMQMRITNEEVLENGDIILICDEGEESDVFTKHLYYGLDMGAIFNKEGKFIKGFMDSHGVSESENAKLFYDLIKKSC